MVDDTGRRRYKSALTDNAAWDDFALRQGDVVVITPPKCGTTWTQSLVLCLIFGRPGMDVSIDEYSIWLDPGFRDQAALKAMLDGQTHRRCIKTHTPMDGIPQEPDLRYIAVYRHPLDAHFSMRRHAANVKMDLFDGRFAAGDGPETFARYLEDPPEHEMGDGVTLAAQVHHFRTLLAVADQQNVILLHYADMKRDLASEAARLSEFLGYNHSPELIREMAESLRFEMVQANARARTEHNERASATFHDPAAFYDSGTNRKWVGRISDDEYAAYRAKLEALLPPDQVRWLEEGGKLA